MQSLSGDALRGVSASVELPQDRSLMVTVRAAIDPLVPKRMVITLTRHMINPVGKTESQATSSITGACRRLEQWLTDFAGSDDEG